MQKGKAEDRNQNPNYHICALVQVACSSPTQVKRKKEDKRKQQWRNIKQEGLPKALEKNGKVKAVWHHPQQKKKKKEKFQKKKERNTEKTW